MRNILNTALPFFIFTLLFSACKNAEPPKQNIKPYQVVEVETRTITGYSIYPTSIQGVNNNDIRAKIQGYIKEVLVDEGQYVQKGQILFRLETNSLSETANAAQANVDAAQANIKAAQANVDVAQVEVDKLKPLVEKGIISPVQLETANANLLRAKSQLDQAKAAYSQAKANYSSAYANVEYSIIRAPISGVIGKINFRVGSLVGPSDPTPITSVSDTKELYAYFSMNESEYLNFLSDMEGSTIKEKLNNLPQVELILANGMVYEEKGQISAVTGQINPQTGSIQFRVSFPNKNGILTNGNSGKIRIPVQYNNALVIPEAGTFEQQGLVYAFKVENDTAKSVIIDVIDRIDNLIIVKNGLQKGDKVIGTGVGGLKTNTPILPNMTTIDSIIKNIKPIF